MPEASVDEDRPPAAAICKIRATGQARHVFPIPEAEPTQGDADPDFRRGVSTPILAMFSDRVIGCRGCRPLAGCCDPEPFNQPSISLGTLG